MITLDELATNSDSKLVQGFVNEIITDSYLLSAMTFDDCLTSTGTSDLSYSYKRVKTPMEAKFRALNSEPAKTKPEIEDLYALYLEESKNAIIRGFNKTVINGDTDAEADGFDGLDKAVKGTSTDMTSKVDLSSITKESALAFAEEMDTFLSLLMRTPDVLMVSPSMKVKINAICRVLGLSNVTMDSAGRRINSWDTIRIEELRDGALATNDIYAACLGMDGFHGITLKGGNAVTVALPDWTSPGAVKSGDAEFVCGCALKATKAAGVLRAKAGAAAAKA